MPENITELLDRLHETLRKNGAFDDKTYTDVPILRTGSQIPRPTPRVELTPELTEMRELTYRSEMHYVPLEELFVRQAKLMESYEDDYEYTESFSLFCPTYADFTAEQLRGYFTWRKHVRAGDFRPAPLPFILLHAFELLNNIGADDPADAHEKLVLLREHYGEDGELSKKLNGWIRDHVIYFGLPSGLLDGDEDIQGDKAMETVLHCRDSSDSELFEALTALSSYKLDRSVFYRERPEEFTAALCGIYRELDAHYAESGAGTLFLRLFGRRAECIHYIFKGAVFRKQGNQPDREYIVNGIRRYKYRLGLWFLDTYHTDRSSGKHLGDLMRSAEVVMREKLGAKHRLSGVTATKAEVSVIQRALDRYIEEKKRAETERIEIDVTKLGGIRKAADITRDKLIVEEEPDMALPAAPAVAEPAPEPEPDTPDLPLNAGELAFLRHLLYGSPAPTGMMPTLLADSINEKLFDMFGDTVLDMNGGDPRVLDDYEQELKGTIPE